MKRLRRIVQMMISFLGKRTSNQLMILLTLVLLLSSCSLGHDSVQGVAVADTSNIPQLTDLNDIGELKELFNQDIGKPRIILLLSPT